METEQSIFSLCVKLWVVLTLTADERLVTCLAGTSTGGGGMLARSEDDMTWWHFWFGFLIMICSWWILLTERWNYFFLKCHNMGRQRLTQHWSWFFRHYTGAHLCLWSRCVACGFRWHWQLLTERYFNPSAWWIYKACHLFHRRMSSDWPRTECSYLFFRNNPTLHIHTVHNFYCLLNFFLFSIP